MAPIGTAVFATLLMNDGYLPGAMVLGHSLKDRGAKARLVCFVVLDKLSHGTITELKTLYDDVVPVQQIYNRTPANLYLMDRPDLISTFTKIELWKQTQYKRIVYIDADVVAIRAPNELLTIETQFAAVPDIGWPDCFNSGMMVLNPNLADYYSLLALAERGISFDGADQGLLNMHFTEWERLSFAYNCTPSGSYQYVPAYRHFQSSINLVHFIGRSKPWNLGRSHQNGSGVYGELLGRWWAVYDRHYRRQETVYYSGSWQNAPKKVQDFVAGEETIYLPAHQAPPAAQPAQGSRYQPSSQGVPPPSITVQSPPPLDSSGNAIPSVERPFGEQPRIEEQALKNELTPTPTAEQRRWSAPHVEWEPSRAPPPTNSKPEASNFPSTIYEMSESRELFKAPTTYPDAPKDMWYTVPEKVAPPAKPKPIFPWESRAPKPTRVFAEPRAPSPPPPPVVDLAPDAASDESESAQGDNRASSTTTDAVSEYSASSGNTQEPEIDPWSTFSQRTNAWDDMPEITKYMQAITGAKKGNIQVLHHTPNVSRASHGLTSPIASRRRQSLIITDFPTVTERPSLPVTPAPIRRSIVWGDDGDRESELPGAKGVPQPEEWVRRFSSYPQPSFNSLPPLAHQDHGILCFQCQFCGKQNPIAKLEELQQQQTQALLGKGLMTLGEAPTREMPESASKEAAVRAAEKAMTPPAKAPLKPILKEPSFEVEDIHSDSEISRPSPRSVSTRRSAALFSPPLDEPLSPASTVAARTGVNPFTTSYLSDAPSSSAALSTEGATDYQSASTSSSTNKKETSSNMQSGD